jgi:PASTA domain
MIPIMRIRRLPSALVVLSLAAAAVAIASPPASAQATRTWVSGVGDDVNPCSRTAPCKTWAGAISKTAVGGEIDAMDDGGFGAVTITKAITINGGGHLASALANGTDGIIINAPATAQVVLRGIDIKGVNAAEGNCTGLNGVNILGAASVRLDDVSIGGFQRAVSTPLTNSSVDVFVDLSFNDLRINDNCAYGLRIAPATGHPARLTLDDTTITGSNVALSVAAGGEAWVSDSQIYLNNVGVQPDGTGKIHALCGNSVAGNASDGAFTDYTCGGATVAATPTPAPTYCTVPQLKKKTAAQAASALKAASCTLGKVKKQQSARKNKGKVIAQDVPAGILVKAGTAVKLVVGK